MNWFGLKEWCYAALVVMGVVLCFAVFMLFLVSL